MEEKLIYVTNSEKSIIHLLEYVLTCNSEYTIKTFSSHKDLIANLVKKPDIVVMGQNFNNGLDALKEIKQFNKEVPVIILADQKEKDLELKFIENGAYKCISQSGFFVDSLLDTLDKALHLKISA